MGASSRTRHRDRAASILESGVPCDAVIAEIQSLGMRDPNGDDMYAFVLRVIAEGPEYETRIGDAVPAAALRLLHPGNTLPARRAIGDESPEIAIDWQAAINNTPRQTRG